MGRKKKALAVMIPALALVSSACQSAPEGVNAGKAGGVQYLAGAPTGDPSAEPPADPSGDPNTFGRRGAPGGPRGGQNGGGQNGGGQNGGQNGSPIAPGPLRNQFVSIRNAPRLVQPPPGRNASRGVFSVNCGTNDGQAHSNPDNVVAAPGVVNGAHHIHDYVGNLDTDAFSTDESLAAAGTTCTNGDKSAYFWPVLRLRSGRDDSQRAGQSRLDGNVGSIIEPTQARLQFLGNARTKVTAMPRFIRMATGDAKSATNGLANANAKWTCTGFQGQAFTDKYPLCPSGSSLVRVLDFPSCWDGRNTDSANHRDHILFADERTGQCQRGTVAVPALRMTLVYNVPAKAQAFALDSFPEQGHNPVTDHADFINVMSNRLMQQAVTTINSGRRG